jgi:hypothetical protein
MKHIYILIILLVFAANAKSQAIWGPPFPLTDSLTDNVNATLSILPGEFVQADTLYMLWERSSDSLSTGIYARNLTTMAAPFIVAGYINAHFKHPRVFRRGSGDTLFFFSYETDVNGNWDIYYSALLKSELTAGPFPFIKSSQNERSLNFGTPETFSWEKEGSVFVKDITGDTVLLASDSCASPVQSGDAYVAYEWTVTGQQSVFYSKFNSNSNIWTGPFPVDVYGINKHPTLGNDSYGDIMAPYLFWQHQNGSFWTIKGFDLVNQQFVSVNNFSNSNNVSPSYCTINLTTGQDYLPNVHFFTFSSDVTGNTEIYVNNWIYDTTYTNISVHSGNDVHPQLFNNFHAFPSGNFRTSPSGLDNQLFDIWESYHGGRWQLWATNMDILTGENTSTGPTGQIMKCSPNPFATETRIEYNTIDKGLVVIDIYDLRGNKIKSLNSLSDGNGKHWVTWDGKDAAGIPLPAGIYMGVVKTGNTVNRCKIIRL